eukprot:TRINITY_DN17870_c0_g3_i1.p1 TRINITY_DN17870_c0_g3~~TRINITY_DN17870_c0_g3_i1.p1  ORF type:complete len:527 (-),score=149.62 TRINITY_DN17870_c0_g3_i1:96-1676(-)
MAPSHQAGMAPKPPEGTDAVPANPVAEQNPLRISERSTTRMNQSERSMASNVSRTDSITSADAKETNEKPAHPCAQFVYYIIAFFALWFGSDKFDMDGDGDFDQKDVQCFLAENGFLSEKYLMSEEEKEQARRRGRARRKIKAQEKRRAERAAKRAAEAKKNAKKNKGMELPSLPEMSSAGGVLGAFDRNGDGHMDIDDFLENTVEGEAQDEEAMEEMLSGKSRPYFFIFEILATVGLWLGTVAYRASQEEGNMLAMKGGLDVILNSKTSLTISTDMCGDLRPEAWRWLTYQFSHVGLSHIGMNTVLNVMLGLPLEAMHGWWRAALMYNAGVLGGSLCYFVTDAHSIVVGCSGGCYSLIGIHTADLIMNWSQKKFRCPVIVLLTLLVGIDLVTYYSGGHGTSSNAAHVGGVVAGLIVGVLLCDNAKVKDYEKVIMAVLGFVGVCLTALCLTWLFIQDAGPRTVFEALNGEQGWCWVRAVLDARVNPTNWQCIRCGTKDCIASFDDSYMKAEVDPHFCDAGGYLDMR